MSDSNAPARPSQVTLAGWMVIVGSAFVVLSVADSLSRLRSVETREAVTTALAEPPLKGLGVSVEQALDFLQIISMVAAGCATAAAILGWQVLRRDRSARLVLTILAVPLFLTGIAGGGFLTALVAVSAWMLWTQPARDWFSGRTAPAAGASRMASPTAAPGDVPAYPPNVPRPPGGDPALLNRSPGSAATRPDQVLWACVLTWVAAGFTALMLLLVVTATLLDRERMLEQLREGGLSSATDTELLTGLYVGAGVLLVWSLAAIVLAVFVFLGRPGARVALIVSGLAAMLMSLASVVALLVTLPLVIACGLTVSFLMRPEVAAWFRTA